MSDKKTMFIPNKITVGYNERHNHSKYDDISCEKCFNSDIELNCDNCDYHKSFKYLLAFITYKNNKGELKQPKSFDSWIDKDIPLSEFENTPLEGFKIQQTIKRSTDWFGSGANKWRILDPRGFFVEISSENLLALIENINIIDRTIQDKCIYAWSGKTLSIIPISSDIYKDAINTTQLSKQQESFKNVKIGNTVILKNANFDKCVYLGKLYTTSLQCTSKWNDPAYVSEFIKNELFTFYIPEENKCIFRKTLPKIHKICIEEPIYNVQEIINNFNNTIKRNKDHLNNEHKCTKPFFNFTGDVPFLSDEILYIDSKPFEISDIQEEEVTLDKSIYDKFFINNELKFLNGIYTYDNEEYFYDTSIGFMIDNKFYCLGYNKNINDKISLLYFYRDLIIDKNKFKILSRGDIKSKLKFVEKNPFIEKSFNNCKYTVYFVKINNTNIYLNYKDICRVY